MNRPGELSGVDAFGFVSWFQAFDTWPSTPPSALASPITTSTGISASTPSSTRPASRLACGDAGRSSARNPATSPSAKTSTSMSSRSAPSSWPASERTGSGRSSVVSPVIVNVQAISGTAPADAPSRTIAPRSRSGVTANQKASPTPSASSEPRE